MSAGQDHTITIKPGGVERIKANGESFLFCKFSDRDIRVSIGGREVIMRGGSYQEFEPLSGEQSNILLFNPDEENAAAVVFVTGTGTYDEKIIRGEIVIDPRVKTADGRYVSDQRATNNILVSFDWKREPVISKGDSTTLVLIDKAEFPDGKFSHGGFSIDGDLQWTFYQTSSGKYIVGIDRESQSIAVVQDAPNTSAKSIIKKGGLIYAAVANQKYLYSYSYGRTSALTADDRVNAFAVEGAFLQNVFCGPGGDVWAMDSDYKFYNMTQGYKAFDPTDANMRTGCAFGNDVVALSNAEEWQQYSQDNDGNWVLAGSGVAVGSWNDLAGAFYDSERGLFVVSDNKGLSTGDYAVYEVEPEAFEAGEIHYGAAVQHCTRLPGLLNPAQTHRERTTADVSVVWENGRTYVSGEVIKATLELLGIDTSGDYMDAITAFRASAKYQEYNINLGGRTFSADKIADDFEAVELPQVLTITALNTLWSNRA